MGEKHPIERLKFLVHMASDDQTICLHKANADVLVDAICRLESENTKLKKELELAEAVCESAWTGVDSGNAGEFVRKLEAWKALKEKKA